MLCPLPGMLSLPPPHIIPIWKAQFKFVLDPASLAKQKEPLKPWAFTDLFTTLPVCHCLLGAEAMVLVITSVHNILLIKSDCMWDLPNKCCHLHNPTSFWFNFSLDPFEFEPQTTNPGHLFPRLLVHEHNTQVGNLGFRIFLCPSFSLWRLLPHLTLIQSFCPPG